MKIASLERKTRKAELEELKRDLGYYTQIDIDNAKGRQNVFIEGEKLLRARLDLKDIREKRAELDMIKKKLK